MLCPFTPSGHTRIVVKEYQLSFGAAPRDGFGWVIYAKLPFQAPIPKADVLSPPRLATQLLKRNVTSTWASPGKRSTASSASVFPEVNGFVFLSSLNLPGVHKADACLWLPCRGHPMPCRTVPVFSGQTWKKPRQPTFSAVWTEWWTRRALRIISRPILMINMHKSKKHPWARVSVTAWACC